MEVFLPLLHLWSWERVEEKVLATAVIVSNWQTSYLLLLLQQWARLPGLVEKGHILAGVATHTVGIVAGPSEE